MLLVDTQKGMVLNDEDVKEFYAGALPYGEWLDLSLIHIFFKMRNGAYPFARPGKKMDAVVLFQYSTRIL